MKIIIKILVSIVIAYLSFTLLAQDRPSSKDRDSQETREKIPGKKIDIADEDNQEMEDDDFYPYDQAIVPGKLYQKNLPPLSRKAKIIWSFRLADTNSFL